VLAGWGALVAGGLGAACNGEPSRDQSRPGPPAAPATVEWLVWDRSEVWGRVADQFNQQATNVRAGVTQNVVNADVFAEKLQAAVAGGTAPDVAMSSPIWVRPLVEAQVYRPIDDLARRERGWLERYYPAALDTFRVRGKLFGVWHYANPQVVFYNQELLASSGVAPPPGDWTYQQWLEASKRITKAGEPATAVWGTDAPTSFNYVFNAIRSYGGALFDDDETPRRFTGTATRTLEGLQFLADLLLTHRVAPTAADRQGQGNLFVAGRQGFSTVIVVAIGDYRRQMKQPWDAAPMPRGPAGRSCFFGANGTAFTVPGGRDPAPGWEFLKFLGGTAGQKEYLAEFGSVPTLKALTETEYLRQPAPPSRLNAVVEAMSYIKPLPKLPSTSLQQTIDAAFQAVFNGQKGTKAAMDEIEGPVNQALRG
jgi:multiple sugar transport system substrate-binding protein